MGRGGGLLPPGCAAPAALPRAAPLGTAGANAAPKGEPGQGCPGRGAGMALGEMDEAEWWGSPVKKTAGLTLGFSRHAAKMLK